MTKPAAALDLAQFEGLEDTTPNWPAFVSGYYTLLAECKRQRDVIANYELIDQSMREGVAKQREQIKVLRETLDSVLQGARMVAMPVSSYDALDSVLDQARAALKATE